MPKFTREQIVFAKVMSECSPHKGTCFGCYKEDICCLDCKKVWGCSFTCSMIGGKKYTENNP